MLRCAVDAPFCCPILCWNRRTVYLPQRPQNSHSTHGRQAICTVRTGTQRSVCFAGERFFKHQQGNSRMPQIHCKHQQRWHLYHVGWPHFSGTQARHEQPSPFKCRNRAGRNEAPSPEYAGKMQPSGRYAVGILRDRACL